MADAMITVVVERVADFIVDRVRNEVNLVRGVENELVSLSDKLKAIKNLLVDAENQVVKSQNVKCWLKKLENIAYEMDNFLDEWNYFLHEHKMEASARQKICRSFIPSSCLCLKKLSSHRHTAKKIENLKSKVDETLKEKDAFNLVTFEPDHAPISSRLQSTSLIEIEKVHGWDIENNKKLIMSKMLNGGGIQILSIVGPGGIGKTVLAQYIYNDPQFAKGWEKIWVCVSDSFVVDVVAKNIVTNVGKKTIPSNDDQLEVVLRTLKASVENTKFLLVLDDIWNEDEEKWNCLKMNLKYGAEGSKILVTTRNERVAKMMGTLTDDIYSPMPLSLDECWSLLRDISLSGKTKEECEEFEYVGKNIASKCQGLPLAAIFLGRHLQPKISLEEWEDVEKSDTWQLKNNNVDLFSHLVLSYNDLSPTLKHCFSYCAVYPKDHRIHAESLIEEWMALGYLGSVSGNELEIKGRQCLNDLAMRSLFQDIEKSESGEKIEWCKMHDIVHDFALFIRKNDEAAEMRKKSCEIRDPLLVSQVQEYHSLFWDDRSVGAHDLCDCVTSVRVLRVKSAIGGPLVKKLIHLRLLDFSWIALSADYLRIVCRLYFLQTLLLSGCSLTEIPREIENLIHLRRLDLSHNKELKELPESMSRLVELRTLSLAECSLTVICRGIGNLVQLSRLDLSGNEKLGELPEIICSLVELRNLSLARCSLTEIREEIRKLVQLRRLDLSCNGQLMELPESICSLVKLQILNIENTGVIFLPQSMDKLSNLHTLQLSAFKVGSDYNKLGFLKKLHRCFTGSLTLEICFGRTSEMEELVKDAGEAEIKKLLQKLERLEIYFESTMNEKERSSSPSPSSSSSPSKWMTLLDALVPHHNLKKLAITGYKDSRLPNWMLLNSIKEIHLADLSKVSSLPAMGKLPFLEILWIERVEMLQLIGREFIGIEPSSDDDVVAFPKLKQLTFLDCSKWKEWEDITEEEESAAISIMPCLTELSLIFCKSLKELPHRLLHKASSSLPLSLLDIRGSPKLVKTYREDKEGSPWRSISKHNPKLQLRQQWY